MKTTLLIIAMLALCSCTKEAWKRHAWQTAPQTHQCSAAQFEKVETETIFCTTNTDFFSTYCFGTAILRNCTESANNGS